MTQSQSTNDPKLPRQLLVVEDEANILKLLCAELRSAGYVCDGVADGRGALDAINARRYDIVVLDVMLPRLSGIAVCEAVRRGQTNRDVPILMLTARGDERDKLAGFQSGADDYLTKPFSMPELIARVGALSRRVGTTTQLPLTVSPVIVVGNLRLDPARRTVEIHSVRTPVTLHEFRLLYELASKPGVVFTRERLLPVVWQGEPFATTRAIDTLVRRVRLKIEEDPAAPVYLQTVWGDGYKFADPESLR